MFDYTILPVGKRNCRRVQLGSGANNPADWINIDYSLSEGADLAVDLNQPLPFDDNSIEEFYSHHVLEHFNRPQLTTLLLEIKRCLKPGGKLTSRLPDLEWAMRQLLELPPGRVADNMLACIYGANVLGWQPAIAHTHYCGWTSKTMRLKLVEVGFRVEKCESVGPRSEIPVIDFTAIK